MLIGLGAAVLAGLASTGTPNLDAVASLADAIAYDSMVSSASITLTANGDVLNITEANGEIDVGDWIAPKDGMGQFSCKWTDTTGTINIGTAGSWLPLTDDRTFGVTIDDGDGGKSATGTLAIAYTDATGTTLVSKAGIVLSARSSSLPSP